MSKVFNFFRTIVMPVAKEDERPKYVPGQFVAGSKHYLIEEQQQKARGFLRNCGAWERQFGSGRNP
jgi:hypothetical protein